mmetsp:Transcript_51721/g.137163  ORF Transcript_51721/g.137163 Transcript_51721/m.137163 type:complete len:325 (-) Transcript_51721:64-1038(-)
MRAPSALPSPVALQPPRKPAGSHRAAPHKGVRSRCAPVSPARCIAPRRAAAPAPPASPARCAAGSRRAPRHRLPPLVVVRWVASGGTAPAAVRGRLRWRAPLHRAAPSRRAIRRRPAWWPRGAAARASARPAAAPVPAPVATRGVRVRAPPGGTWLRVASRCAALLGASRRCPPCRSHRVLRRRLWLCVVLQPGTAGRAAPPAALRRAPAVWPCCRGWARHTPHARPQGSCEQRARPSEGAAAAGWRLGSSSFLRAMGKMAGGAGWAGRGFERGATRRRMLPPRPAAADRCGRRAPSMHQVALVTEAVLAGAATWRASVRAGGH